MTHARVARPTRSIPFGIVAIIVAPHSEFSSIRTDNEDEARARGEARDEKNLHRILKRHQNKTTKKRVNKLFVCVSVCERVRIIIEEVGNFQAGITHEVQFY